MLIDHIPECKSRWHNGGKDCICDELRAYEERCRQEGWIEQTSEGERMAQEWVRGYNESVERAATQLGINFLDRKWGAYMRGVLMESVSRLKE